MTNFEQFQKSVGVPSDHHRGDMAIFKLPTSIFTWLKKACTEARGHKNKVNSQLAGHIKEEYDFKNINRLLIGHLQFVRYHPNLLFEFPDAFSFTTGLTENLNLIRIGLQMVSRNQG